MATEDRNNRSAEGHETNTAPTTVPVQIEKLDAPTTDTFKGDLEGMEIGPTTGDLGEGGGPSTSPYQPIIRRLKEAGIKEFASKEYNILDPYSMTRSQRTVVGIERISQELESSRIFIARGTNRRLMEYTGSYWKALDEEGFKSFLAQAMIALGFKSEDISHYSSKDELYKQFEDGCQVLRSPEREEILINLANGTLEISHGSFKLRESRREDYMTYQLPFSYDPDSTCPRFQAFLDEVLPEPESQQILAEFFGSAFIDNRRLKLEKALLLYGFGSNGKSTVFQVMEMLFGEENFSTYSLESITDTSGYSRAKLDGKLLNYASEISGDINTGKFKQLVSGESIEVRLPYKEPYLMTKIPKLAFNINGFPRNSEKTGAFYRRLLIVPFMVQIPPALQDKTLARQITDRELSGVFNWVLDGMKRLIKQQAFTDSPAAADLLEDFRLESDVVASFLKESEISPSDDGSTLSLKLLHGQLNTYCNTCRVKTLSSQEFRRRLEQLGFACKKANVGIVVYAKRKVAGGEPSKRWYPKFE